MGSLHMTSLPAMLIFHGILVAHYLLLRHFPSRSAISSSCAVLTLFGYSLVIRADIPFVTIFMRVAAVLFSMQIVRLQIDPTWSSVVQRSSLTNYLLSVISFGPADTSVAAERKEPLSIASVMNEALFMLLKYLVINAIHVYFHFYPYRRDPPLRGFLPPNMRAFIEYYLLALRTFSRACHLSFLWPFACLCHAL